MPAQRRRPGRPPEPRPGDRFAKQPYGFPLFCAGPKARVITADAWAFLQHLIERDLPAQAASRARAYVDQACDFYRAAENPQIGSKPLLYYYAFLNLVKAALLLRGVPIPPRVRHGIEDPAANVRTRIRLEGQQVRFVGRAANRSKLFPELWAMLGGPTGRPRSFAVIDLLAQIPPIQRTYCSVTDRQTVLVPVSRVEVRRDSQSVWVRLAFDRHRHDVQATLPTVASRTTFRGFFRRVHAAAAHEWWYESTPRPAKGPKLRPAVLKLASDLRALPWSTIATGDGYRLYLVDVPPREYLHPLVASYAAMFYLGSITRYKPDVFSKFIDGRHSSIVEEFMATGPRRSPSHHMNLTKRGGGSWSRRSSFTNVPFAGYAQCSTDSRGSDAGKASSGEAVV